MVLPTDWFGLGVIAALVVPGLVYGDVLRFLGGYTAHDKSSAARLMRAVLVSVVFDTAYFTALGVILVPVLADPAAVVTSAPVTSGIVFGTLALVIPALVALIIHRISKLELEGTGGRWRTFLERIAARSRNDVPTAWDWAIAGRRAEWVRVRIAPGTWVGGKWDAGSLASDYPERPELFLTEPWTLDDEGVWLAPLERADGIWVAVEPAYVVIWEHSGPREKEDRQDG